MTNPPTLPSDRQLVQAARTGHQAAWAELMSRHEAPIRAVVPSRPRSAKRGVTRTLEQLRTELDDHHSSSDIAVRAFRPRAIAAITGGSYGPVPVGELDSDSAATEDQYMLARAFGRLPEPWQTALWHTHVEQLSAAEVSPLVGRTVNEVGELIGTAERGLTDAFLIEYVDAGPLPDDASTLVPLLSGHVRDALPAHEARIVAQHLAGVDDGPSHAESGVREHTSDDSRRLVSIASSLPTALPPAIAPGLTGLNVQALRRALGTASRAFGAESMATNKSSRLRIAAVVGCAAAALIAVGAIALLTSRSGVNATGSIADGIEPSPNSTPSTTLVDDQVEPGETTTTTLDLRPSGPASEIELVVNQGSGASGGDEPADSLVTAVSTPAPVFAGGTGTIDLSIANDGDEAATAFVELNLPRGVVFDDVANGDTTCTDPADDSPYCDVTVPAGGQVDLSVRLGLESTTVGRLSVTGDSVDDPFEAQIVATGDLVHNSVGRGDVVVAGNTVMTCDADVTQEDGINCDAVTGGIGTVVNRWDVPMEFVGQAPAFGFINSSSAVVDVPDTATIVSAHLFWAGDLEEGDVTAGDGGPNSATIVAPGADPVDVEASNVTFGEEDATQYLSRVDVTDVIAGGGGGEYLVGNIESAETQGSFGAWALVVVFDDDSQPRRHRMVTDPFVWVAPQAPFEFGVALPVPVVAGATAQLDVVAFEGERGFQPEELTVAGTAIGGTNPFDSTIVGERTPSFDNNLGVDIDAYDLKIDTPNGTLDIAAQSEDDGIRLAVLGLTVDLDE